MILADPASENLEKVCSKVLEEKEVVWWVMLDRVILWETSIS